MKVSYNRVIFLLLLPYLILLAIGAFLLTANYQIDQQLYRWQKMCEGPARYDAMREAYAAKMPNPCNGAMP